MDKKEDKLEREREMAILSHAVGWPKNNRNYFAAGEDAIKTCEKLVKYGAMIKRNLEWSDYPVYQVTPSGRIALKIHMK